MRCDGAIAGSDRKSGNPGKTALRALAAAVLLSVACSLPLVAQQADGAAVIRMVDANVAKRVNRVLGFTDIETYSVYRGNDETHPAATMTVRDNYTKGVGKSYTVLSHTGSGVILKFGLRPLIDNETEINKPANVQRSWFTSANYEMKLRPGTEQVNGRRCYALAIKPRQTAPNLVDGTLWVDALDGSIVKVEGVASKSPSPFAGTTHMMRDYINIEGFPMATHARAESKSFLFGRTVVVIEYRDYHLQVRK